MIIKGDKVKFSPELRKIMSRPAFHGFNHNRMIYEVLDTCYNINGIAMAELNNDGIHYLIECSMLILVKEQTVGIIIE